MINPDVFINFILDQSGSMSALRSATIEGFNAFMAEQRQQPGQAYCSLTLFSTQFDARFVARPLAEMPDLGGFDNPYSPGGGTALLDAVGTTIKGTEAWLSRHPEFSGKVVCVVLTDGEENSSREWHIKQPMVPGDQRDLAGLIQWKQNEGWEFIFLGSGGSAWLERNFGHVVSADRFLGYTNDAHTNRRVYAGVSANLTRSRVSGAAFVAPEAEPESVTP